MVSQFCGKCGNVNTNQMNFCLECGNNLMMETQVTPPLPPSPFSTTQQRPQRFSQPNFSPSPTNSPFQENKFQVPPPSFVPIQPNTGFQSGSATTPPAKFEHPAPLTDTVNTQKKGTGGKIVSFLGGLVVILFLFLKFGLVFLRVGRFGFVGVVIVGVVALALAAVSFAIKRG